MRDIGLLAVGAIVGFVAAWAKAMWIDAPRDRARRRETEREGAYRALADALNEPRKALEHVNLMHEIERPHELSDRWWKPIDAGIETFKDEWDANWSYTLGTDKPMGDMVDRVWVSNARMAMAIDPDLTTKPKPPNVVGERAAGLFAEIKAIQDHARRAATT